MQFRNTETPTFPGAGGLTPAIVEAFDLLDHQGNVVGTFSKNAAGAYDFAFSGSFTPTSQTIGGYSVLTTASGLRVAHCKYDFAVDGGAQGTIAPTNSDTIPANAIIVGGTINSTTAVTSNGSATVALGTSAGSSTTALKGATGKASYSANAVLNGVPVFATPVKLTAAGTITFTIGAADLTAGVIEAWFYYVVAAA